MSRADDSPVMSLKRPPEARQRPSLPIAPEAREGPGLPITNVLLMGFWFMWVQMNISVPLVAT